MNEILKKQLAIDFCCTPEMVESRENIFTEYHAQDGRRIFKESECFLKVASVQGKLLASGKPDIIKWVKSRYQNEDAAWFMDIKNLRTLDEGLKAFGCQVGQAHPFYIATEKSEIDTKDFEIRTYMGGELEQFRGDARFDEAFLFEAIPKDEIGIAAYLDGEILGVAGATSDSPWMWQIGINVMQKARGLGVGAMLVALLKNEILDMGRLPVYGTSMSHIASQRVACHAGFYPAWAELYCKKIT